MKVNVKVAMQHLNSCIGGRMINSANRRYGSGNFGVISSINCSSCIGDYCTINDCEWSETYDLLCLGHTRDAALQCYNGD